MPADILKILTELGLSDTESKAYLASLRLGPGSVQMIAKESKLSRTATYDAIENLEKRGLFSSFERGKKRFYTAEEPERAAAYFRENVHRAEDTLETFLGAIPELRLAIGGERPSVHFYEGREGLSALFRDITAVAPKELDEVSNREDILNSLDDKFLAEARKAMDPEKMRYRILVRGAGPSARSKVQTCRIPDDIKVFHGDIIIYGNRVAFVTFVGKPITVIIESQPLADTARALFDVAWRTCLNQ